MFVTEEVDPSLPTSIVKVAFNEDTQHGALTSIDYPGVSALDLPEDELRRLTVPDHSNASLNDAFHSSRRLPDQYLASALLGLRMGMAGLFLDIGRGPDCVEGTLEAEPGIDVARKIAGRLDDRLEGSPDEGVAMLLGAVQRPGVTAEEGKVRGEVLT